MNIYDQYLAILQMFFNPQKQDQEALRQAERKAEREDEKLQKAA